MRILAPIVTAVSLTVSAAAQDDIKPSQETGSRIFTAPKKAADPSLVARFSKRVARCTFSRIGSGSVDRFLRASDPMNTDFEGTDIDWNRFDQAAQYCTEDRIEEYNADVRLAQLDLGLTPKRMRSLLLEEAYLAVRDTPVSIAEGEGEITDRTFVSVGSELVSAQGLGNFADCIVHRDATGADGLLRTEPGTSEETAAAQALAPVLGSCLIDGQTIEFTAASIRSIAADGLWSRVVYGSQGTAE